MEPCKAREDSDAEATASIIQWEILATYEINFLKKRRIPLSFTSLSHHCLVLSRFGPVKTSVSQKS